MIKRLLLALLCLFALFLIPSVLGATNISSCTNIADGGEYELNGTLSNSTVCLTITADNVDLNCKGNSILYGASGANGAIGITATYGVIPKSNLTIRNCVIQDINAGGTTGYGILLTRFSNSRIYNNTILTNGSSSNHGIYLTTGSDNNIIENNVVRALGTSTGNYGIHVLTSSNNNTIRNNVVSATGTTTSYAIFVSTSSGFGNIVNNTLATISTASSGNTDGHVVYISGSIDTLISDNLIYGRSLTRNYAVYLYNGENLTVRNNTIILNSTGSTNYGVYSLYTPDSLIIDNEIDVNGTTTNYGVYLSSATHNEIVNNSIIAKGISVFGIYTLSSTGEIIRGNVISTAGTGATSYGVYFSLSYDSEVVNNSINVTGTTPLYGVYLLNSEDNVIGDNLVTTYGTTANSPMSIGLSANGNHIFNNTLEARGTSTLNYGAYFTQNLGNIFEGNNITTNGTTTNYGIYLLTNVKSAIIRNNLVSTYGTTTNYGMFVSGSNSNLITGNNITTNGTTKNGATNNWGIHLAVSSEGNEIHNNTVITDGGGSNYGLSLITNSRDNEYSGNRIYAGGNSTSNIGIYVSESHSNTFRENIISTNGTGTDYGVYLHSSSRGNLIKQNNLSTVGSTTSHAFDFLFVTPGYPENNTFQSNNLLSIAGRDFNFETASINGTSFVNQPLGNYSFTGIGGTVNIKNESAGEIRYVASINGTNTTFSERVYVSDNLAFISSTTSLLNRSAQITLYNRPTESTQLQIFLDGAVCPSHVCSNLTSMQAGNVTFSVTGGGNYSILPSDYVAHAVSLLGPLNNTNISTSSYNFNFSVIDETSINFSCYLYLDDVINVANSTIKNGTVNSMIGGNITAGNHYWYINCLDEGNNSVNSETRAISNPSPLIVMNSPANGSAVNGNYSALLNVSVSDTTGSNITVWFYRDNSLVNWTSVQNSGNAYYNSVNLSLGLHNWSVIAGDGISNSSSSTAFFNMYNLTLTCEAGGPYQAGALVLAQGVLSNGITGVPNIINWTLYLSGVAFQTGQINSSANGSFQTTFSGLFSSNFFTLNFSSSYQGSTVICGDNFSVQGDGSTSTSASLILDKSASLTLLNSTTSIYNVSLKTINAGGSLAVNVSVTDSDAGTTYSIGNISASSFKLNSYLLSYPRNSSPYNVTLVAANASGNNYNGTGLSAVSGQTTLVIPSVSGSSSFVLDRIVSVYNFTSTTITYNITLRLTNKGSGDASSSNITDSNSVDSPYIIGTVSAGESVLKSYLQNFTRNSSTYYYILSIASAHGTDSSSGADVSANSTSVSLAIPSTTNGPQLTLVKSAQYNSENSTAVNYSLSLQIINSGGTDLTGISVTDSDISLSTSVSLNMTQSSNYSGSVIVAKTASSHTWSSALANATVGGVSYYSNNLQILIPSTYSNSSLSLARSASLLLTNSSSVVYNITLEVVNSGGRNITGTNITDSNSANSPYAIGNLVPAQKSSVSYLYSVQRLSYNTNVTLTSASVNGTDSVTGGEVSASTSSLVLSIPGTGSNASLVLVKSAGVYLLNSTTILYNVSLLLTNAGGSNATNTQIFDTDYSGSPFTIGNIPAGSSAIKSYLKEFNLQSTTYSQNLSVATANATDVLTGQSVNTSSNLVTISVPSSSTSANVILTKSSSVLLLNSTTAVYNISLFLTNSGGSNATNTTIYDSDSSSSPYFIGNLTPGASVLKSYTKAFARQNDTYQSNLSIAYVNSTDSLNGTAISYSSSLSTLIIPGTGFPASLVLTKALSLYDLNSTTISYNVSLFLTNAGELQAIYATINDSNSPSSPYLIGNLSSGQTILKSYVLYYIRNSTGYNVTLFMAMANGTDSIGSNLSANSSVISIVIPGTVSPTNLVILKNAQYLSENSTSVTYNLTTQVVNSGGTDTGGINLSDSDIGLYSLINLNKSQSYIISGTRNISKSYLVQNWNFSLTNATYNGVSYYSNQLQILVPAIASNSSIIISRAASLYLLNSTNAIYNITLQTTNAGGRNLTSAVVTDSNSLSSPYTVGTLVPAQVSYLSYLYSTTRLSYTSNATLSVAFVNATDSITGENKSSSTPSLVLSIPGIGTNASLVLSKSAAIYFLNSTTISYNVSLLLTNAGGQNATNSSISDSDYGVHSIGTLSAGSSVARSYLLYFGRQASATQQSLSNANASGVDFLNGQTITASASGFNVSIPGSENSASLVLDKIVDLYGINSSAIVYNISLKLINKGGASALNSNVSDSDSSSSPYSIGTISAGSFATVSYLKSFERQNGFSSYTTSKAQAVANDSYAGSLIFANSSILNLSIPGIEFGQQLTLIKNVDYNSENSTAVNYSLSLQVVNSGGINLTGISIIDSDLDLVTTISLNQTQSYSYSGSVIVTKAASDTEKDFVAATATVNSTVYQSNAPSVIIPGYGGPADVIVYAPASVNASDSFSSTIQVLNMNHDAGQDFTVDYWITSNDEGSNYSSGQKTIYVPASGQTNTTVIMAAPSVNGTYKLKAFVSWVGGTASAYDSFQVGVAESQGGDSGGGSDDGSSGSGGGTPSITGGVTQIVQQPQEVVCNPPYIRHGEDCCLDSNQNGICDSDEAPQESPPSSSESSSSDRLNSAGLLLREILSRISEALFRESGKLNVPNRKVLSIIFSAVLSLLLIVSLILKLRRPRRFPHGSLTAVRGKKVATCDGLLIGKVREAYVDGHTHKIYGWVIDVDKKYHGRIRKKRILVKQKHVHALKEIMILDEASSRHLDKFDELR